MYLTEPKPKLCYFMFISFCLLFYKLNKSSMICVILRMRLVSVTGVIPEFVVERGECEKGDR